MIKNVKVTNPNGSAPLVHNEHIVPRFYLNKFADAEKYLIVYTAGKEPRRKSTRSQSSEENYFEYTINGHATANAYENWFQKIETAAAPIYDLVHAGSALTQPQERTWSLFLATLFLRSRKVREQIGPGLMKQVESEIFFGDEQIREMQNDLLKRGVLAYFEDLKATVDQIKHEMKVPAFGHLAGIEENARTLAKDIFNKRWFVLHAAPGSSFITSDCPVQTMSLDVAAKAVTLGSGFRHENTAIVLPLSPQSLFLAGPQRLSWKSQILDANDVSAFNTSIARFASRAVYALEMRREVKALVDREMNQVVFGHNAFVPLTPTAS